MSNVIDILITVDTDKVKKDHPSPSKNPSKPTSIAHDYGYMVASGTTVNSGQGTGDLNIKAGVGDIVRAFAVSGSDNFEDAVLLYGMPSFQGKSVMTDFSYVKFSDKSAIEPSPGNSPLPGTIAPETFWFFQSSVDEVGTQGYQVQFALYSRDSSGKPALFGYYQWDPTIQVTS